MCLYPLFCYDGMSQPSTNSRDIIESLHSIACGITQEVILQALRLVEEDD